MEAFKNIISYIIDSIHFDLLMRLLLAALCGAVIGIERSHNRKEAGLRTHALIALGSAAYMAISIHGFNDFTDKGVLGLGGYDPSMIAHQIVNGISFMGAGIIFKSKRSSVTGLATAAGIWLTAAIGMACGGGLYYPAIFCALLTIPLQRTLERKVPFTFQKIEIIIENTPAAWNVLKTEKKRRGLEITHSKYQREGSDRIRLVLQLKLTESIQFDDALQFFNDHDEIKEISTL